MALSLVSERSFSQLINLYLPFDSPIYLSISVSFHIVFISIALADFAPVSGLVCESLFSTYLCSYMPELHVNTYFYPLPPLLFTLAMAA